MKITLLCTDDLHPVNAYLYDWMQRNKDSHDISLVRSRDELHGGDLLFLVSCGELIRLEERKRYNYSLVLHASNLPKGRGWSPHIWRILEGGSEITVTLLEAEDNVDSGRIWHQTKFTVSPDALWNEINANLFAAEIGLIDYAVNHYHSISPREQSSIIEPTYYPRRTPKDSRIDPGKTLESQFNQIRICDPIRFPAFFDLHGHRYKITLEKIYD